jgi:hypothetical protein
MTIVNAPAPFQSIDDMVDDDMKRRHKIMYRNKTRKSRECVFVLFLVDRFNRPYLESESATAFEMMAEPICPAGFRSASVRLEVVRSLGLFAHHRGVSVISMYVAASNRRKRTCILFTGKSRAG